MLHKLIKNYWPPVLLTVVTVIVAFLNYQPNSWLIGWDNLMPELGTRININRSLNTLWQEYQSLGLLGGMAHAADLPRQLLTELILSFRFPSSLVRYFWTFTTMILGPLGVYQLSINTILRKFPQSTRKLAAFFAGLFYLLNLGTVQVFFTPFETFIFFWGLFPWLPLSIVNYLKSPSKKSFLLTVFIHFFAAPAFYVQTIFVVYILTLIPFWFYNLSTSKNLKEKVLPILFSFIVIFVTSSYWLLPAAYFSVTNASTTTTSAQNQVATREVIARNQEYGKLKDVSILRGFWFDYVDLSTNNQFEFITTPWNKHLENQVITYIGYSFFIIILLGLFFSFKRNLSYRWPVGVIFVLCIFFLTNLNEPTKPLYLFIQNNVPLAKDFFRSVFTKWSIPATLSFSLLFGVGVLYILDLFSTLEYKHTEKLTSFSVALALLIYSAPIFQGHLISENLRKKLPQDYLDLFNYFSQQDPSTRIANLPQHTFWGWYYTDWGYRGSGFLWYGIEQPILDRAFDVWSKSSEDYYFEIRQAIYSQNLALFEALLEKYSISWLLIDNSVIIPATPDQRGLFLEQTKKMIASSNKIQKDQTFGFLETYKVNLSTKPTSFVDTLSYQPNTQVDQPISDPLPDNIFSTPTDNTSTSKDTALNCDNFNKDYFTKTVLPNQLKYEAINAMSCDHFLFPKLPHSYAYKVSLTHKNESGEPFLVCFEGYTTGQCEYFGYLPKSSSWKTTELLIPKMKPGDYGYTLHLYSYSIGQNKTVNYLKDILIEPIYYSSYNLTKNSDIQYNNIQEVQKSSYSYYKVITTPTNKETLLTLNQAYHPGWKAFTFKDKQNLPAPLLYLYAITGSPVSSKNHFSNKGWENTWVIPANTKEVVIIFTPQIIQYLGFILPICLIPIFFLHKSKKAPVEGR